MNSKIVLTPIGEVRVSEEVWRLEIEEPYRPALAGLEGFGYIQVLWWAHLTDSEELRAIRTCPQPYHGGPAELGLFATRSPVRPNPIALTAVPLLHVDIARGTIHIAYIDAEDGTPVLDIKPYHPSVDRVRDAGVPAWCAAWPQWLEDSATFDWDAVFEYA
jgi:tRNA-Thr(GGU) m(6)t(6)A37 methyltransferase TsaA